MSKWIRLPRWGRRVLGSEKESEKMERNRAPWQPVYLTGSQLAFRNTRQVRRILNRARERYEKAWAK